MAAAATFGGNGTCQTARIVVGSTGSSPRRATEAEESLVGKQLTDEVIEEAAKLGTVPFRPQDNTDLGSRYRKWMVEVYVARALRDLADAA